MTESIRTELYGTRTCPYTAELREDLEWRSVAFVEYDVELDAVARRRLRRLIGGVITLPVLVEDCRVVSTGWQGRGCYFSVTSDE
jgi:glutaredoxin 3